MKGERVRRQAPFLGKVLNEANANKRKELLRIADEDKINAVSEFVLNNLRVNVPQSRYTVALLKPHARTLRNMSDPTKDIKKGQKVMIAQTGGSFWPELKRCYKRHCYGGGYSQHGD